MANVTNANNETVTKAQKDAITAEEIAQNKKMKEFYEQQAKEAQEHAAALAESQQAATDLAINQIEQGKTQLKEDYKKEQTAAYTDYQKQINPYGVNAEIMADNGLLNSGYSESSKVRIYNQYQQRVALNRSTYETALVNFNNAIAEAKRQNSSALAQIAYDGFKQATAFLEEAKKYDIKQEIQSEVVVEDEVEDEPNLQPATATLLNEQQIKALEQEFARNSMNGTNVPTLEKINELMSTGELDENTGLYLLENYVPHYEELIKVVK